MENDYLLLLGSKTPGKMEKLCEGLAITHVPPLSRLSSTLSLSVCHLPITQR